MSAPYIGQVIIVGFNFAPSGFALCNGQLQPIDQNQALYAILGTTYGGDGQTTFALPNLQGRLPIHVGQGPGLSNYVEGQTSGTETITLNGNQIPQHNHLGNVVNANSNLKNPSGAVALGNVSGTNTNLYSAAANVNTTMAANIVGTVGGSQPHNNIMPMLTVTYCIALFGIFPSRN